MASMDVTPAQGTEVVRLANDKGLSTEQFQALLDGGIIADVLEMSKLGRVPERNAFRQGIGLDPFYEPRDWPLWKRIKNGTHKTTAELLAATESEGFKVSDWSKDIASKPAFKVADTECDVELVVVSVAELGFPQGAYFRDIVPRGIQLGLEKCKPEDGPQLRRAYKDQPNGEVLRLAMDAIVVSGGRLRVFGVDRGGLKLWLLTDRGRPDRFWLGDYRWVFRRRKQS